MSSISRLVKIFTEINDENKMREFFKEIFTDIEREDFTLRWRLMEVLYKKIS